MARFSRLDVLNTIIDLGLMPLFFNHDVDKAKQIVTACAAGGARVVEFTNRGDRAPYIFLQLAEYCAREHPDIILGVGTVMDTPTAAIYLGYGANFVVGPNLNTDVARLCNRHKVAYIPGCATPTEISEAESWGAELVKIFPGNAVGGPDFVRAVLGPSPWTRMVVTGGVDPTEVGIRAWFGAGATAVGLGSKLITREAVDNDNYELITAKVKAVLGWIQQCC